MKNFIKTVPTSNSVPGNRAGAIQFSLCLLAAALILSSTSVAQKQNKSTPRQAIQSSANSVNTSTDYKVKTLNGKLILSDGKTEKVVSNKSVASSPLVNGNEIYYIGKGDGSSLSSGSSIYVYNIKTKTTEDIIGPNSSACSYDLKNVVENLLLDKNSGKIYFSSSSKNKRGYTQFLTWHYDINSKQLAVYKDGRIESIDQSGNHVIVFEGFNSKGKYTSRSLVGPGGNTIKELGTENVSKTIE